MEEVSQTERYRAGVYREQILAAVRQPRRHRGACCPAPHQAGRRRRRRRRGRPRPASRSRPTAAQCGRDTTTPSSYDEETTDLAYTCSSCGFTGVTNLATQDEGKLVWKVDWPMRWAFEHVDFEPAGMDHATPGSSFTVGHELVESVFGMPRPAWFGYGFVGFAGTQKMSSSAGGAPTASDALRVLEAPILRWLYVRRQPAPGLRHRLRPRGRAAVRRVGRTGPQGRRPASATAPCSPTSGRRRPRPPARCRRPR